MLNWLLRFLCAALVLIVVVYVVRLLLSMVALPEPAGVVVWLIVAVCVVIAAIRLLGWPPPGP